MEALRRTLFQAFARQNLVLLEITARRASLEDVFIELSENKEDTEA